MVEEDRYCVDVLLQIASAQAALGQAGKVVLRSHVETCVTDAIESGKPGDRRQKIDELFEVLTLLQTGKTKKRMPIVLYGSAYWDQVVNLERMAHYGTIDAVDINLIYKCDSVDCAFEYITTELSGYALAHPGATL